MASRSHKRKRATSGLDLDDLSVSNPPSQPPLTNEPGLPSSSVPSRLCLPTQDGVQQTNEEAQDDGKEDFIKRVRDFLSVRPKRLPVVEYPKETSTKTRIPSFYDMHLHKDLRLKRIIILEDLPGIVESEAERYITGYTKPKGHTEWPKLPKPQVGYRLDYRWKTEAEVVAYFLDLLKPCAFLASRLLFNAGEDQLTPLLNFSTAPSGGGRTCAVADIFMAPNLVEAALPSVEHLQDFKLLNQYRLEHPIVAEAKNRKCGAEHLRPETIEGDFDWYACQERLNDEGPSPVCSRNLKSHRKNGRRVATGRKTGPDADFIDGLLQKSVQYDKLHNSRSAKRQRMNPDSSVRSQTNTEVDDIMQQSWAQAVAEDATFIILTCGDRVYIGIRSRKDQILYLSPSIDPPAANSPTFATIMVSTIIVAYHDALNRARQLDRLATTPGSPIPPLYNLDIDRENRPNNEADLQRIGVPAADSKESDERILSLLDRVSNVSVRFHSRKDQFVAWQMDPNKLGLTRLVPLDPPGPVTSPQEDINKIVFLDAETTKTQRVYVCFLGVFDKITRNSVYFSRPVYVKLARQDAERGLLMKEHENYRRLKSSSAVGVLAQYGLFECQVTSPPDKPWYCLLIQDGGTSFHDRFTKKKEQREKNAKSHSSKNSPKYKAALASFHENGLLHRDLGDTHLVYDDGKREAHLISLSSCGEVPIQGAEKEKKEEMSQLFKIIQAYK